MRHHSNSRFPPIFFTRRVAPESVLVAFLLASFLAGCNRSPKAAAGAAPTAAKVLPAIPKEGSLTTVELTPEQEKRLGIATLPIEVRKIQRMRTYGGEVTLPLGASIIVSAPVPGTLAAPLDRDVPKVGEKVAHRQPVFLLLPLLSPERAVLTPAERIRFAEARNAVATSRIDAQGLVDQATVQVDAAQIAFDRAERLFKEKAGNARTMDETLAQLNLAKKTLQAAKARKMLVDNINLDEEAGKLTPLAIEAPQAGIMRAAHAVAGEVVAAAAPLFEVVNVDSIWVKVAVYVGELPEIDTERPAQIKGSTDSRGAELIGAEAKPVSAPPTATALASTADLYYELQNGKGELRPGQRLDVSLPLRGKTEQRGIPWSAVVQDINGGSWVYETTAEHIYVRRRVQVKYVIDGWAVLERGPATGAKIVTAGVAELFGTEFGFGK